MNVKNSSTSGIERTCVVASFMANYYSLLVRRENHFLHKMCVAIF